MNRDPIEILDAYYEACGRAQASEPVQPRRSRGMAIPALGVALGLAAAAALAFCPAEPSPEASRRAAEVLAQRQLKSAQPVPGVGATQRRAKSWNA